MEIRSSELSEKLKTANTLNEYSCSSHITENPTIVSKNRTVTRHFFIVKYGIRVIVKIPATANSSITKKGMKSAPGFPIPANATKNAAENNPNKNIFEMKWYKLVIIFNYSYGPLAFDGRLSIYFFLIFKNLNGDFTVIFFWTSFL